MQLTDRQRRMLAAGIFHFDSGGDNRQNLIDASDLERRGLITIRENVYSQHSVFQCEATDAGRAAREDSNAEASASQNGVVPPEHSR